MLIKLAPVLLFLSACGLESTLSHEPEVSEIGSELAVTVGNLTITESLRYGNAQVYVTIANSSSSAAQAWSKTYTYTAGGTLGSGAWPCTYTNDAANHRVTISRTQPASSSSICQININGAGTFDPLVASSGDTKAPTVSLMAPIGGAAVSANVTLAASASDNTGVVGVQFLLDGQAYGAEDTSSPYSLSMDTRLIANGVHTLAARARDAAGNKATSPAASITISNATSPPPLAGWSSAPAMGTVTYTADDDSIIFDLPVVAGAVDYRIISLANNPTVTVSSGREKVDGATISCAGYLQHNSKFTGTRTLLRRVQVPGVKQSTSFMIEAVDRACPFVGALGNASKLINVTIDELIPADRVIFPIVTESEVRQRYGSLFLNGHGKADVLAQPADVGLASPVVLARSTITVSPVARANKDAFFETFSNDTDQPVQVAGDPISAAVPDAGRSQRGKLFQNSRWSFYSFGAIQQQLFIARGQLQTLLADWGQDIMSTNVMYPRRTVALSNDSYLHVTFETTGLSTSRRYWWFSLCGAQAAGQTMDASGKLTQNIVQTPFFYQADGRNPSLAGWNCLQVFPRDGYLYNLGTDGTPPESDVLVMTNTAGAPATANVLNVSPAQYPESWIPRSWYRMQNASGTPTAAMLDAQLVNSPSARYDLYIRRDRVVMYVDGAQKLCNDFSAHPLTMAEGALGLGQVLYHTSAERLEFSRDYWDRTGNRYLMENTPFVDARPWDNIGFTERVPSISGFDATQCYRFTP